MTKEQFRRELLFRATMRSVEQLRSSGVLTDSEYDETAEIAVIFSKGMWILQSPIDFPAFQSD